MPSHANPVDWFEIPVTDMARAKAFYEAILKVEITDAEMGENNLEGNRVALHQAPSDS